jgi:flagellar basal body-associated protein FliL
MDWIPIVLITFKLLVLGAAMFFSIKSHHDKQKEEQEEERQRQARAAGTGSALQFWQVRQPVEASQGARESVRGQ